MAVLGGGGGLTVALRTSNATRRVLVTSSRVQGAGCYIIHKEKAEINDQHDTYTCVNSNV